MFNFLKKTKIVALDIGQRSIKGVSLKKNRGRVFLERAFLFDAYSENNEYPNNVKTAENLKIIAEVQNLKKAKVIFNIGIYNIQTFDITLPTMPQKELKIVLEGEIEKQINYPLNKCSYDYLVESEIVHNEEEEKQYKIKVFMTKMNKIKIQSDFLKMADMGPLIADADTEAIIRMLNYNSYIVENHSHVIIDFGETHISIMLTVGNKLQVLAQVGSSMGLINHKLSQLYSLKYGEVEKLKEKINMTNESIQSDEEKKVKELYIEMLEKIQEVIDNFTEFHFKKWPIASFFLIGGGSICQGLCEIFQEHYKTPCIIPNPFKNIELENNDPNLEKIVLEKNYLMGTSVGLALRDFA